MTKQKIYAKNISWETDGDKSALKSLPKKVLIPESVYEGETDRDTIKDLVSDYLSDKYGWLHNGYDLDMPELKAENIRIYFVRGYTGSPKCGVTIGDETKSGMSVGEIERKGLSRGKEYVIDIEWLETYLLKQIEEKGYTINQNKRQKYPRLTINA